MSALLCCWICSMALGAARYGELHGGLVLTGLIMARLMSTRVSSAIAEEQQ